MNSRLETVLSAIDAANSLDPVWEPDIDGQEQPRALLYGRRMSLILDEFRRDAGDQLRIAARAQHIERWSIPRTSYAEGRVSYLRWRKDLQAHHARRTGEIMAAAGYGSSDIDRVATLLRKERIKFDPDVQTLEDVACLVFLRYEAPRFITRHDDDKVRDILAKTAVKMSPEGLGAAAAVPLDTRLARLLAEALEHARVTAKQLPAG
ncbi:MAG: DUF4202 domain-containing protein [Hyphomicrobiales bacterium]